MPEIIVKLGDRVVQKYLLYKDQRMTIGRAPDNDIALENPAVSRRHASVQQVNGRYILEDNNSANGTYVNGVRISKTEILDKDVVTIGKHKLHFYNQDFATVGAAPPADEPPPAAGEGAGQSAVLRSIQGKQRDQFFDLVDGETRIGRAADNDIRLHDWFVSKHHAVVSRKGGGFVIRDLDSWRHTMVNGEVVQEAVLKHGDEIQFGPKISMRFELRAGDVGGEGSGRRPVELGEAPPPGEPLAEETDAPATEGYAAAEGEAFETPGESEAEAQPTGAVGEDGVQTTREMPEAAGEEEESRDETFEVSSPAAPEGDSGSGETAGAAEEGEKSEEVLMWEKALQNSSKAIRKQAARKLKKLTGRDYDVE